MVLENVSGQKSHSFLLVRTAGVDIQDPEVESTQEFT
jgi:hypothetical protein